MDTADGLHEPGVRLGLEPDPHKVYYNLTVTSLSVAVALIVGTIELLQVAASRLGLEGGFWGYLNEVDFVLVSATRTVCFFLLSVRRLRADLEDVLDRAALGSIG